jgi:hypothetical protein
MSVEVFKADCRFRRNGEQVPFNELVNSPSLLLEVTTDYNRRKSRPISHLEEGLGRTYQDQRALDRYKGERRRHELVD